MDTELHVLKTASKKVVHKATKATDEFIGNEIVDAAAKSNDDTTVKAKPVVDENSKNAEEIIIPPEKRIKTRIIKWNTIRY